MRFHTINNSSNSTWARERTTAILNSITKQRPEWQTIITRRNKCTISNSRHIKCHHSNKDILCHRSSSNRDTLKSSNSSKFITLPLLHNSNRCIMLLLNHHHNNNRCIKDRFQSKLLQLHNKDKSILLLLLRLSLFRHFTNSSNNNSKPQQLLKHLFNKDKFTPTLFQQDITKEQTTRMHDQPSEDEESEERRNYYNSEI